MVLDVVGVVGVVVDCVVECVVGCVVDCVVGVVGLLVTVVGMVVGFTNLTSLLDPIICKASLNGVTVDPPSAVTSGPSSVP